jgi:hypothetical protein
MVESCGQHEQVLREIHAIHHDLRPIARVTDPQIRGNETFKNPFCGVIGIRAARGGIYNVLS